MNLFLLESLEKSEGPMLLKDLSLLLLTLLSSQSYEIFLLELMGGMLGLAAEAVVPYSSPMKSRARLFKLLLLLEPMVNILLRS
jgi:hypothetical protein